MQIDHYSKREIRKALYKNELDLVAAFIVAYYLKEY